MTPGTTTRETERGTGRATTDRPHHEPRTVHTAPRTEGAPARKPPVGALIGTVLGTLVLAVGVLLGAMWLLEIGTDATLADPTARDQFGGELLQLLLPVGLILVGGVIAVSCALAGRRAHTGR